jgi:hypothetical protein
LIVWEARLRFAERCYRLIDVIKDVVWRRFDRRFSLDGKEGHTVSGGYKSQSTKYSALGGLSRRRRTESVD